MFSFSKKISVLITLFVLFLSGLVVSSLILNPSSVSAGAPTTKYFQFNFTNNDPAESFIVKVTDQAIADQLIQDLNGPRKLIVSGTVVAGNGGFNHSGTRYFSWSLDPSTIVTGENFIELCDSRPTMVEAEAGSWVGHQYCPWYSHVAAVYDTPPSLTYGEIGVSPRVCYIKPGQTTCSQNVLWSVNYPQSTVQVRVREAGNALFAQAPYGSAVAPWASKSPLHMDLYDGATLKGTTLVQGVDQMPITSPGGLITSSVNPCILQSNGMCTARISWNASAYPNVTITIKEASGALFAAAPYGSQDAPWIYSTGITFELRSNNVVVDSLLVKGVNIAN